MTEIPSRLKNISRVAKLFIVGVLATASLLIPAALAQGAKVSKAVADAIKRNKAQLRRRLRANPQLAYTAQPPRATYGVTKRTARRLRGTAHASAAIGSKCSAKAGATFNRQPGTPPGAPDAINSYWANTSTCSGQPVQVSVVTNMVDPHGTGNSDYAVGTNYAQATGLQQGPEGNWKMLNQSQWVAPPGKVWKQATGFCAGLETPVLTCKYNQSYPILLP